MIQTYVIYFEKPPPMHYMHPSGHCRNCHHITHERKVEYPIFRLGYTLCESCQAQLQQKMMQTSEETLLLYFALRDRKVPAELEQSAGYKLADISIARARINIAVESPAPEKQDSLAPNGFMTLRISDDQIRNNLVETTYYIEAFVKESYRRIG